MIRKSFSYACLLLLLCSWNHLSIFDEKALYREHQALSYADPKAKKGGALKIASEGAFETLNPFSYGPHSRFLMSYVYQTLGQKTLDEKYTVYPLLAETFKVAGNLKSMDVRIFKNAKFSDGHPVESEDVIFTFESLKEQNPFYKNHWADVKGIEALSRKALRIHFHRYFKELPLLILEMPVIPKHRFGGSALRKAMSREAVGSGPYLLSSYKFGSHITVRKNPDFWAKDHGFHRGRYNFETLHLDFYRNRFSLVQAFKKGDYDFFPVFFVKNWFEDFQGPFFDRGWIVKETWKQKRNQGASGYFFNLHNTALQDLNLRKAMVLAFDFEWTNRILFRGHYKESLSLFENSIFKAPSPLRKSQMLCLDSLRKKYGNIVPQEFLNISEMRKWPQKKKKLQIQSWLKGAGYTLKSKKWERQSKTLELSLLVQSESGLRVAETYKESLRAYGISLNIDFADGSSFTRKLRARDFDLVFLRIPMSESPGKEQFPLWHSKFSQTKEGRNYWGLSHKGVDLLLEQARNATSGRLYRETLQCLDALIRSLHLFIPNWYTDHYQVAYWDYLKRPAQLPFYYSEWDSLEFMWMDIRRETEIKALRQKKGLRK